MTMTRDETNYGAIDVALDQIEYVTELREINDQQRKRIESLEKRADHRAGIIRMMNGQYDTLAEENERLKEKVRELGGDPDDV